MWELWHVGICNYIWVITICNNKCRAYTHKHTHTNSVSGCFRRSGSATGNGQLRWIIIWEAKTCARLQAQMKMTSDSLWLRECEKGGIVLWKLLLLLLRAAVIFYDPINPGDMPERFSQALHFLSLLVEGTGDAKRCWLPWQVNALSWKIRLPGIYVQESSLLIDNWNIQGNYGLLM